MDDEEARDWARLDGAAVARLTARYEGIVLRTLRDQGWRLDPEFDDLEQEARLALLSAIRSFDPARGTKFSSFALPRIIGALLQYKRTKGSWVRRTGQRALAAVQAATTELEMRGEPVTDEAIIARLADACDLARARRLPTLVDLTDEDRAAVEEELPDPDADLLAEVEARAVAECFQRLPYLQRKAAALLYLQGLTPAEVARRMRIRPGVLRRYVISRANRKLAELLDEEAGGKTYIAGRSCHGGRMPGKQYTKLITYLETPEGAEKTARLAQERGISTGELLRQLARKEATKAKKGATK